MLGLGHVAGEAERQVRIRDGGRSVMTSVWDFILLELGSAVHLGEGILTAWAEDGV